MKTMQKILLTVTAIAKERELTLKPDNVKNYSGIFANAIGKAVGYKVKETKNGTNYHLSGVFEVTSGEFVGCSKTLIIPEKKGGAEIINALEGKEDVKINLNVMLNEATLEDSFGRGYTWWCEPAGDLASELNNLKRELK